MLSLIKSYIDPLSPREKLLNALAAIFAILAVGYALEHVPAHGIALPLLASFGASAFLVFVVPHSPMAQPWPLIGGHLLSATIAAAIAHLVDQPVAAAAFSVGTSVLAMQLLRCLHPPAAATALAIALGGAQFHGAWLQVIGYSVLGSSLLLLAIALTIDRLLLGRRYPLWHSHHPHHSEFQKAHAQDPLQLEEQDFAWALSRMDGIVDVSKEDLIDIYELALEHATERSRAAQR